MASTLAGGGTALAASYRCTTSNQTVDDPSYSGPWPDNWDFTVKVCAARSGSTVTSYTKVSWDGPSTGGASIFDGAYVQTQIKRSRSGTDPVVRAANFWGLQPRLERSDGTWGDHNGSYTTAPVSYRIGSRALGDAEIRLDWNNDGAGYHRYLFRASPAV
ncbi:hypothetical protein [Streptomyces decoyicus]